MRGRNSEFSKSYLGIRLTRLRLPSACPSPFAVAARFQEVGERLKLLILWLCLSKLFQIWKPTLMCPSCQVDRTVMLNGSAMILTPESLNTASELSYYFLK